MSLGRVHFPYSDNSLLNSLADWHADPHHHLLPNLVRSSADSISFTWQFGPLSCKRSLWWCFSSAACGRTPSWLMVPRRDRLRSLFATLWPFGISFSQCHWTSDAKTCMQMNQLIYGELLCSQGLCELHVLFGPFNRLSKIVWLH